jgi:hypothetical protein
MSLAQIAASDWSVVPDRTNRSWIAHHHFSGDSSTMIYLREKM